MKPSRTDAGSAAGLAEHVREARRVLPLLAAAFRANPAKGRGWPRRARESSWYLMVVARAVVPAAVGAAGLLAAGLALSVTLVHCRVCGWWASLAICALLLCVLRAGGRARRPRVAPGVVLQPPGPVAGMEASDVMGPQDTQSAAGGWTPEQAALIEWLAQQTYRLGDGQLDTFWGMGAESRQLAFTSRRYHLAFCFYAVAGAFQHVPGYAAEARRILDWLIGQMLDFRTWGYSREYWPEQLDPFTCKENVMWLGHVLAMVTLYEALLGDSRFRSRIAVRDTHGNVFVSSTPALAAHIACAYRDSPHGGLCCEPGLVFFMCQNHALYGLRLEERLSGTSFQDVLDRWESYAMQHFGANVGGAIQLCQVSCLSWQLPARLGHLGADGWSVAYWVPWSPQLPARVWRERVRPVLDPALPALLEPLQEKEAAHGPTTSTCCTLDIPRTASIAYLFAAASAVGDRAVASAMQSWLLAASRRDHAGAMWIPEGRDWSAACTANLLLGISYLRGASLGQVTRIGHGRQLLNIQGARVLRAEHWENDSFLVAVEPSRSYSSSRGVLQSAPAVQVDIAVNFAVTSVFRSSKGRLADEPESITCFQHPSSFSVRLELRYPATLVLFPCPASYVSRYASI